MYFLIEAGAVWLESVLRLFFTFVNEPSKIKIFPFDTSLLMLIFVMIWFNSYCPIIIFSYFVHPLITFYLGMFPITFNHFFVFIPATQITQLFRIL